MMTTPINAIDEITIALSPSEVWKVLADFRGYSHWWPKSLGLRLVSGGDASLGTEMEIRPNGGRPFRCRVEQVVEPQHIRMRYFGGFVDGIGEWLLEPRGGETRVIYRLEVRANGWLVVLLGKMFNLGQIHSRSMQAVLQNLKHILDQRQPMTRKTTDGESDDGRAT